MKKKATSIPFKESTVKKKNKVFTVSVTPEVETQMDRLKETFHLTSKADVFRTALGIMQFAGEASRQGRKLIITDSNDTVIRELYIPGVTATDLDPVYEDQERLVTRPPQPQPQPTPTQ